MNDATRVLDDHYQTCVHEAGHAVVAMELGAEILSISVTAQEVLEDDDLQLHYGEVRCRWRLHQDFQQLQWAMAGFLAEDRLRGEPMPPPDSFADIEDIPTILHRMSFGGQVPLDCAAILQHAHREAVELVVEHWEAILALADQLYERDRVRA